MKEQELKPDRRFLESVFPNDVDLETAQQDIISNNSDTCIFRFQANPLPSGRYLKDVIIRMEKSSGRMHTVMALQRLAYTQLPDLIPQVLCVGTTRAMQGRTIDYSVVEFCADLLTLDTIWDELTRDNQLELIESIVKAVGKLQGLSFDTIPQELADTPFSWHDDTLERQEILIGGPSTGYYRTMKEFMAGLQQSSKGTWTLREDTQGITIESRFQDIENVSLSSEDLEILQRHIVFSHNDLEPRNILVRKATSSRIDNKETHHELGRIIDWEFGGLYPFAYEFARKDEALGCQNLHFSWYTLFKQQSSSLLPSHEAHTKFIKAVNIMEKSQRMSMQRNVGVLFRKLWIQRENLQRSTNTRDGWVRQHGMDVPGNLTAAEHDQMLTDVMREFGSN